MLMREGVQASAPEPQNGHRLDPDHLAAARGYEDRSSQAVDPEELLSLARAEAQALMARAHADAEDLLSRAQSHVDLLRAHAEAVRAEAECLRAEAAALRSVARDEVEAASSHAGTTTEMHATAQKLLAAVQDEADAARDQFERMRTEALAIGRLLRTEIDTGLADVQQLGGDVERVSAQTDKLAAELRLLLARLAAARPSEGPLVDARAARGEVARPRQEEQLAEMLGQIWDRASTEASRVSARRSSGGPATRTADDDWGGGGPAPDVQPVDSHAEPRPASLPLIGSGGWGAREAALPHTGSPASEPAPASTSRRRRRRRG